MPVNYTYRQTMFTALYQEITELEVDAIALPTSPSLYMDAGIAKTIKERGGVSIENEARQHGTCSPGDVVVTGGGTLPAGSVFHCVLLDDTKKASPDALRQCVRKTLEAAAAMGIRTLAFPALGASFPGLSPKSSTEIIVEETKGAVERGLPLSEALFVVCDPTPYAYYKKALKTQFHQKKKKG